MASNKKPVEAKQNTTKFKKTVDLASGDSVVVIYNKRGVDGTDAPDQVFKHTVLIKGKVTINVDLTEDATEDK